MTPPVRADDSITDHTSVTADDSITDDASVTADDSHQRGLMTASSVTGKPVADDGVGDVLMIMSAMKGR